MLSTGGKVRNKIAFRKLTRKWEADKEMDKKPWPGALYLLRWDFLHGQPPEGCPGKVKLSCKSP